MTRTGWTLALAATLGAMPTVSIAADRPALPSAVRADLQCLIIYSAILGSSADKEIVQGATTGTIYYLGRLDGAARPVDLLAEIRAEVPRLEALDTKKLGADCDARLVQRGGEVMAIGDALKKAGL